MPDPQSADHAAPAGGNGVVARVDGYWRVVRDISAFGLLSVVLIYGGQSYLDMQREHNEQMKSTVDKGLGVQVDEMRKVGTKLDNVADELRNTRAATERLEWKLVNAVTKGKDE